MENNDIHVYVIKPGIDLAIHLQQTEEIIVTIAALSDALEKECQILDGMPNNYIRTIGYLIGQSFEVFNKLFSIRALDTTLHIRHCTAFMLKPTALPHQLYSHLCITLGQISAMLHCATNEGVIEYLSDSAGYILISLSLQIQQLILLVEMMQVEPVNGKI